jgi:hypothetical protein
LIREKEIIENLQPKEEVKVENKEGKNGGKPQRDSA